MPPDDQPTVVETTFRVRFAETDAMGVAHHANYLVYFEEGRSELSRQSGAPYAELEAGGFSLAVSEVSVRYVASVCYDQQVTIRTWVEDVRSRSVTFAYEAVVTATKRLLATGQTKHICVDREGKVRRIPPHWREAMRKLAV